jgi:3-phenylpropionate/trans-cinnamate dioxygenase ferredoxin reductase subunit
VSTETESPSGTEAGVVIAGAGLAAAKVAEHLRAGGYTGSITLVGEEEHPPYERPPLSKSYLQGKKSFEQTFAEPADWYAEHDVTLRLGERATGLDPDTHELELESGERLPFGHLVLATGSTPRTLPLPGSELTGVLTLRRIGDSDTLREVLAAGERLVIIGGGWIGLEVAAAAKQAGLEVTVLEGGPLPLQRVLGDRLATHFADLHRTQGVDLRTSQQVAGIVGESGRVTGVQTADGIIPADRVLIGVGARPNTELAEVAGLAVDNGVLVDEHLRTHDPRILAVGDVANAYNKTLGRHLRVEHWDNAKRQGELAAATILGSGMVYDWQPYFYTDQFDLGMEYVGNASAEDEVVIRGDQDSGEFIAFWLHDGVVSAAMNVNIWDVNDDLRAVVGRTVAVQRLTDPEVPLTEL